MPYKTSYAQNREDIIISAFFPDIKEGVYVDVGANHPLFHSVTKLFYDKGWHGVNYEPNPKLFSQLSMHRKKDINVSAAVGKASGEAEIRIYHSRDGLEGISTLSSDMVKEYTAHKNADTLQHEDLKVPVVTLAEDLRRHGIKHIHFMKIDVEGYEYDVIKGNDWEKFRPELMCIEANHIRKDWRPLLKHAHYQLVFNDGLNEYYLAAESAKRKDYFDYAQVFLGSRPVISLAVAEEIKNANRIIHSLEEQKKNLDDQVIHLQEANNSMQAKLNEIVPLRRHIKRQLKRYIRYCLTKLGIRRTMRG